MDRNRERFNQILKLHGGKKKYLSEKLSSAGEKSKHLHINLQDCKNNYLMNVHKIAKKY